MSDQENPGGGEELSPSEEKYFESRGEEAQEAEAQPEPAEKPEGEEKPEGKQPGHVPHAALHEERTKRRASEERTRALEIENARALERLNILLQGQQQAPPKRPSAQEDVFTATDYAVDKVDNLEQRLNAQEQRQQQAYQQQQFQQQLVGWAQQDEAEFAKGAPDYHDAVSHLRNHRIAELKVWGLSDPQIRQTLFNEEMALIHRAAQARQSPAALAYNLAKSRGYTIAQKAGGEDKKLDRIEAGQSASKSLNGAGSKAGGGAIDAAAVLAMSDAEFDAFQKKNPRKFRELMGG